jgi:hypothetical protein
MTKRITILAACFIAANAAEGAAAQPLYPGTTLDLDDQAAGELVVAGKAKYDKDGKLKSTAKDYEAQQEEQAARAQLDPQSAFAKTLAATMATEMAKAMAAQLAQAKPAEKAAA